ncbi:MAG: peptidase MA family metallohydrolase [Candidatus Omnitrophica bacterium]|jgi:hypothetical protein|nr:peptidase MA family metallohydrolase [Candidatus Omnitrophota bacterium]
MKINIAVTIALAVVLFYFKSSFADEKWQEKKGTHFIVCYQNAPEDFINNLMSSAENYYNLIADELGFRRFDFWLWDDRAKIYIYDTKEQYHRLTGQPQWAGGHASLKEKEIYSYAKPSGFSEQILSHEMAHIIFREFVGVGNPAVPVWLDEAVASYHQKTRYIGLRYILQKAYSKGEFIPFSQLIRLNPSMLEDKDKIDLFYMESVSIVDYLIANFGKDYFVYFCRYLRDKKDMDQAIKSAYPINGLKALGDKWESSFKNE